MSLDLRPALRNAAYAVVGVGFLFHAGAAQAFTESECKSIAGTAIDIVKHVGTDKLSPEFRTSLMKFFAPNGKLTCDGPKVIAWRTTEDEATFFDINSMLLLPPTKLSLNKAGVKLAPTSVAALRPEPEQPVVATRDAPVVK